MSLRSVLTSRTIEVLRFFTVGAFNTGVHYALYLPLRLAIPYVLAHMLAWAVATVTSYVLNCRWTFGVRPSLRRALLYPMTSLPNLVATTLGVLALVQLLNVDQRWAPLIAGICAAPLTFFVGRWVLVTSSWITPDPEIDARANPSSDPATRRP